MREHFTVADLRAERLPKGLVVEIRLGGRTKEHSFPDKSSRDTVIEAVRGAGGSARVVTTTIDELHINDPVAFHKGDRVRFNQNNRYRAPEGKENRLGTVFFVKCGPQESFAILWDGRESEEYVNGLYLEHA